MMPTRLRWLILSFDRSLKTSAPSSSFQARFRDATSSVYAGSGRMPAAVASALSARRASRASARIGIAPILYASCAPTLMLTNLTPGCWKAQFDPVTKSASRVPMQMTRSADLPKCAAGCVPRWPVPPTSIGESLRIAPRPAWVSPTGMPQASATAVSSSHASE